MKIWGQAAVVTGAASGIGRAVALLFAKKGARVIVVDLNLPGAQETVAEIKAQGGTATAVMTDVTKQEDIAALFDTAIQTYGTVDILVNNAGIMDNMAAAGDVTDEMWERVLAVNTTSVMRTTRQVLPVFLAQGSGVIVNIASIGGLHGSIAGAAYTASKHAVIGFTKNTAFHYARDGIRCNAIAPGQVMETNITTTMTNLNERGAIICGIGMALSPRAGQPEEIAAAALFLASEDSRFVNGHVLVVDGGWTAYM